MINFNNFYQLIAKSQLSHWLETLPKQISLWQKKSSQKNSKHWNNVISFLPKIKPDKLDLIHGIKAESIKPLSKGEKLRIEKLMYKLIPLRKGPFCLYDVYIDAEWRSDWKWQRILPYISNLKNRIVLDIGCGNGYYLWRIIGAGAQIAIGIDSKQLFLYQFEAIRKLLGNDQRVHLLPIDINQLPSLEAFDTVFSMGVIYHRKSPLDLLWQLKNQLVKGGELVLETLVIDGDAHTVLMPIDRYACMRNVYFIPSVLAIKNWLKKCGFININVVSICTTTIEEQRSTKWMTYSSLIDFLDPKDITKTIEGYPAPIRAVLIATKP